MHRAGVLAACLTALAAGCVLPEPITQEPPPSTPDEAPVILATAPLERVVHASQSAGQCTISVGLPAVSDPSGATITARFFLNDGNPDVIQATNQPLGFEGSGSAVTTDFTLERANQDVQPPQLELTPITIPLSLYQAYLVPPTETSGLNYVEIVVSDGFAAPSNDENFWREAAPGKSVASAFWIIDLSACTGLVP